MNMDCFIKRFCDVLMNDAHDETFETIKMLTGGTTSTRIAKLLNFAVSQIEPDECYVEVGVFSGFTLCSAAHVNRKHTIGIDKYDSKDLEDMGCINPSSIRDRCLHNINSLNCGSKLIEKDFRDVTKDEIGHPVAVAFIDGHHNFQSVKDNLEWLEPLLTDDAAIIFDDVNYAGVSEAIFSWLDAHKDRYEMLAYLKPFYINDRYMSSINERFLNNGVCVLRYHTDPQAQAWIRST